MFAATFKRDRGITFFQSINRCNLKRIILNSSFYSVLFLVVTKLSGKFEKRFKLLSRKPNFFTYYITRK